MTATKKKPAKVQSNIVPAPPPAIAATDLGSKIQQNLCGVYVTIRRPGARPMMKEVSMEATTKDQDIAKVELADVTRPCWKIDVHPLWKEMDGNGTKIESILTRFSVSASVKGEHLVSLLKAGEMLKELNEARQQRLAIADKMKEKWDEILTGLEQKFPQFFQNQIKDRLPDPDTLRNRFDVYWLIRPLTPMDASNLNLSALSEADAREVIERNAEFVDKLAKQQLETIFNEAFMGVVHLCDDINSGEYAFGKRKIGAINEILEMLDRVANFSDFASEEVLTKVHVAKQTISQYNIKQINQSDMVQNTIKNAMLPLGEALKQLAAGVVTTTRAKKVVSL